MACEDITTHSRETFLRSTTQALSLSPWPSRDIQRRRGQHIERCNTHVFTWPVAITYTEARADMGTMAYRAKA